MKVSVNELTPGMVLKKPIIGNNGTLILKEGTVLTEEIIEKIRKMKNIKFIEIDTQQILNDEQGVQETVNASLKNDTKDSLKKFLEDPSSLNMEDVKKNTKKIVEAIKRVDEKELFKYNLQSYKKEGDIYSHSVRVTCFSVILAKIYNRHLRTVRPSKQSLINLEEIAIAGVLHDIGSICNKNGKLDKITEIANIETISKYWPGIKDTPLDRYDKEYSSVYSYSIIGNTPNISAKAKLMILLSNEPELYDGCLKIPDNEKRQRRDYIYAGKIIHVCDIYDKAMKQAIEQNRSLEEIVSELGYYARNGLINDEIEQLLINNVPLYPVGTKVELSSGKKAVVKECFCGNYDSYKPIVRTIPFPGEVIDLRDETTTTIKCINNEENTFDDIVGKQISEMRKSSNKKEPKFYEER